MTRGKYHTREDTSTGIVSDLAKRIGTLETVSNPTVVPFGVITEADYVTPPVQITSGSFVVAYRLFPNVSNRFGIEVLTRITVPGGTTLEVRLVMSASGTVISPVLSQPGAVNGNFGIRGRFTTNYLTDAVEVQARLSSGAGTSRIAVLRAISGDYQSELFT